MDTDNQISKDLLDLIDTEITYKNSNRSQIKSAIIDDVLSDGTVSLHMPPDNAIFSNIQNQSIYKMKKGMNVKVIKENNSSSNMWVIGVFNERNKDVEKRFLEKIGIEELNEIQKYKSIQNFFLETCNGVIDDSDDPGSGGGSGGGGGSDEPLEGYDQVFYDNSELFSLKNYSTSGCLTKINSGNGNEQIDVLTFSIPLNKNAWYLKSIKINNLKMIVIQDGFYLYSDDPNTGGKKDVFNEGNFNTDEFSDIKVSGKNLKNGIISIELYKDKIKKFNDDGYISNSTCGIILDLDILTLRVTEQSYSNVTMVDLVE